jgi:hypothetical protein
MSGTINLQIGGTLQLLLNPVPPAPIVTVTYEGFTATAKGDHMAYTLPVDHFITVQVAYVDAGGNPAAIDGDVTWTSSNPTIAVAEPDPGDDTICKVTPTGALGSAQVVAQADADLGQGVRTLLTTLDVTLVAGEAVAGVINVVGDPEPITP